MPIASTRTTKVSSATIRSEYPPQVIPPKRLSWLYVRTSTGGRPRNPARDPPGSSRKFGMNTCSPRLPGHPLELPHLQPSGRDFANDFMAGNDRKRASRPVVADLVQIGTTNPAVQNVDLDVVWTRFPSREAEKSKGRCRAFGCVTAHRTHGKSPLTRPSLWPAFTLSDLLPNAGLLRPKERV